MHCICILRTIFLQIQKKKTFYRNFIFTYIFFPFQLFFNKIVCSTFDNNVLKNGFRFFKSLINFRSRQPLTFGIRLHFVKLFNLLNSEELIQHIEGCSLNNRQSQKKIYCAFYGYAISTCSRYTNRQEDAVEILNDGFLKIFKEIHRFTPAYADVTGSFKGWLSKIMVYTAIDYNRKYHHQDLMTFLNGKVMDFCRITINRGRHFIFYASVEQQG